MKNKKRRNFSNDFDYINNNYIQKFNTDINNNYNTNYIYNKNLSLTINQQNNFMKTLNAFRLNKPKNLQLLGIHKNHLHNKIKNNSMYQKFFITENKEINKKIFLIDKEINKNNNNKSRNYFSPLSSSTKFYSSKSNFRTLDKLNENRTKTIFLLSNKNNNLTSKTLYNVNYFKKIPIYRSENLYEFNTKIHKIIREKFIKHNKLDFLDKIFQKNDNLKESYQLNINLYNNTLKLLQKYNNIYDNYEKYLYKILRIEKEKNLLLIQKQNQLRIDILRLINKQHKMQGILKESINKKFFLMCVKNSSNFLEKFSKEDYNIIRYDQKLLYQRLYPKIHINIISSNKKEKKKLINRKSSHFIGNFKFIKKKQSVFIPIDFDYNYVPKKNYPIFETPDDFIIKFNSFANKVTEMLITYIKIQDYILLNKKELDEITNDKYIKLYFNNLRKEIDLSEEKLYERKIKNKELNDMKIKLKNLSFINKMKKINFKIYGLYNNLNKIIKLKIEKSYKVINNLHYLKSIENGINKLLLIIEEDKKKYPLQFYEIKNKIIKIKINEQNIAAIEEEKKNYNNKLKLIYEKTTKIIYKQRRKLEINDIYFINKEKKIKKNILSDEENFDI